MRTLGLLGILSLFLPSAGWAQQDDCNLVNEPGSTTRVERRLEGDRPLVYVWGRFTIRCATGAVLRADEAVVDELANEVRLTGAVDFQDPLRSLRSQQATYNSATGRLFATGDVLLSQLAEGTTLRGPELEYFRPVQGRTEPLVVAPGRPHLTLRPPAAQPGDLALEVDADLIRITGQDRLSATGDVLITRGAVRATSGVADYDGTRDSLDLRGEARIEQAAQTLRGERIRARLPAGVLEHAQAEGEAQLATADLTLSASNIHLFFRDEMLQRVVARTPADPQDSILAIATTERFRLQADSLEALLPSQALERVTAVGRARGEALATPATAEVRLPSPLPAEIRPLIERDWIQGDTVVAEFTGRDSVPGDTVRFLRRLRALQNAQALYRIPPEDPTSQPLAAINYLSGDLITLTFLGGEIEEASVQGLRRGIYLDPKERSPEGSPPPSSEVQQSAGPLSGSRRR